MQEQLRDLLVRQHKAKTEGDEAAAKQKGLKTKKMKSNLESLGYSFDDDEENPAH